MSESWLDFVKNNYNPSADNAGREAVINGYPLSYATEDGGMTWVTSGIEALPGPGPLVYPSLNYVLEPISQDALIGWCERLCDLVSVVVGRVMFVISQRWISFINLATGKSFDTPVPQDYIGTWGVAALVQKIAAELA